MVEEECKNNRRPTVFLSSVFRGLLHQRHNLYDVVTQDYGWECLGYEFQTERFGGAPRSACIKAVDDSDLYIGVFWKRAGSAIPHDNLRLTELEYYRARKSRKPMRIYVVAAKPSQIDANLKLFLETIKEPDNGQCIQFCKDFGELLSSFKRDLDYFGDCWEEGKPLPWLPSLLMDRVLESLGFLLEHTELYHLPKQALVATTKSVDVESIKQTINTMRSHYERSEFLRSGEIGSQILLSFLNAGISVEKKKLLPLWVRFLRMWAGTCTWLNILNVPYGAVWAARVLRETYEAEEQWSSFSDSASLLSHVYYVEACSLDDEKHSLAVGFGNKQFERERLEIFKLQLELEKERQDRLKKALNYDKLYVVRSKPRFLYLYRAYIYQVMGHYDQAIRDFESMADDRLYGSSEFNYLDTIADLGTTKIIKATKGGLSSSSKRKLIAEGLTSLSEAHEKVQRYASYPWLPAYLIIEKEYAKGLLNVGEKISAKMLLDPLYSLAKEEGLSQQARSINILLNRANGLIA